MAPPKEHRKPPPPDADTRLRDLGWEIYSRPVRGPVLWWQRNLNIVRTQNEALEWCSRELKRVER